MKNLIGLTLAAAAVCLTTPAQSADVTLTGWTFGAGNEVSSTAPTYTGLAGGYTGFFNGASFQTYCVELTEYFSFSPQPMSGYSDIEAAIYFGDTQKVETLRNLLTYVQDTQVVTTAAMSTSFQLAVWNAVYDNDFTLNSGAFRDNSQYAAYATTLLQDSTKLPYKSTLNLFVLQKAGSQDFLYVQTIPEPTPALMLFAGIAVIAFVSMRKKNG